MKKFNNAMSDMDLEMVVCGAGFGYIVKKDNGNFVVLGYPTKLTSEQVRGLIKGDLTQTHGLKNEEMVLLLDVPQKHLETVKKTLVSHFDGCGFLLPPMIKCKKTPIKKCR